MADEIVVVDSGSTDKTGDCGALGSRFIHAAAIHRAAVSFAEKCCTLDGCSVLTPTRFFR
ncbi:hypothetical protein MASR1M66_01930 [Aminivibrio sp.]